MKRKSSIVILAGLVLSSITAVVGGTLSWFSATALMRNSENPIEGTVEDEYYASGTGTSSDPFYITKPRHLYNLAWLQYLGFYNKNTGNDNHQFYFKLGGNIDMSQFGAIPPIGTELNPFVGNFDGAGYVVSKLTISNTFSDYVSHPSAINAWDNDTTHKQPHILGFFGVIGEYPGGNKNSVYSTSVNELKNTGLTGVTIKTELPNSLMGVAAGYVRDSDTTDSHNVLKNIVIDNSKISLPNSGATSSYGKDINNNNLTKISEYSLVGYTNNKSSIVKGSKQVYGVNIENNINFNATEDGDTEGWGGSIDMKSVLERLQNLMNLGSWSSFTYKKTVDYHEGQPNQNTTDTTDNTSITKVIADSNHEEWGHFNFISESDYRSDYALMGGGHFEGNRYYEFLQSTKITTDGTHYLTVSRYNNNQAVSDTTENNAKTWSVPSGTTGKVYCANGNTKYYLNINNTTSLRIVTSEDSGTVFNRIENNGKILLTYEDYYVNYDNGWKMTKITGGPTVPTAPTVPTIPTLPTEPTPPAVTEPQESDYDGLTYQISDGSNYANYISDTNATFISSISSHPWSYTNSLVNNGTTLIYVTVNGVNHYIKKSTGGSANAQFTTNVDEAAEWTISESNGQYRFYYRYSTGTFITSTYYYYLRSYNNNLYFTRSNRNSSLSVNTATAFTFKDSHAIYLEALSAYNAIIAAYNNEVTQYNADLAQYYLDYDEYLEKVDYYNNTQYPEYLSLLEEYNTNYATYLKGLCNLTLTGGLSNTEYLDHETGTMNYEDDDVTYFPLTTVDNTSNFNAAENNTAYVVAGSNITKDTTDYGSDLTNVRFSKYYTISNNISSCYSSSTGEFTHIYTVANNNGTLVRQEITDASGYERFEDATKSLGSIMKGQSLTYGLHFMESAISMDALTTAKYVQVNNEDPKTNYELPVNSIDFFLKEFGHITFIAGTYFVQTSGQRLRNNSFFSLYEIERTEAEPNKINRILEINNIYQHTSKAKNYSYVYELTDGVSTFYSKPYKLLDSEGHKAWLDENDLTPYSENQYLDYLPLDYTKVFDVSTIRKNSINSDDFDKKVFYFEIPMNDGEFCLGSVSGGVGSYLMYLDIGANAAKTNRTIIYEKFSLTEKTYSYPSGVALQPLPTTLSTDPTIDISAVVDASDSVCVEIRANANGDYIIDRSENSVALTRANTTLAPPVYVGEDVTLTGSGELTPVHISSTSYDIDRMQYYDYMINTDSLCVTTITDFNGAGNNGSTVRTIEQNRYSGQLVNENPTSQLLYDTTGILGTVQDDSSNMKIYNSSSGIKYSASAIVDTNSLTIDSNKLSNTLILEFKILQNGGNEYEDSTKLVLAVDSEASQTDTYYKFGNYTIVLTPNVGTITVKVVSYAGSFNATVYDFTNSTSTTVNTVTVIVINGETVTGNNQVIPAS